jgi:mersacidin/lichenicidin family type 2 lantibiotic
MSNLEVIRAWKDVRYRRGLSAAELAGLPQNPAGLVELSHGELRKASGFGPVAQTTAITCTASLGGCCPGTTAATCTSTYGGCCPPDLR